MITTDNIIEVKRISAGLWDYLKALQGRLADSPVRVVPSRSGLPTITVDRDGTDYYVHSKYDPAQEAEGMVEQFDPAEVENYEHVFFYGVGLGYHVEAFMKRFPKHFFSLYEPSPQAFCHYLSERQFNNLPLKRMKNLFIENQPEDTETNAQRFFEKTHEQLMFVTLPSYERVFSEDMERFKKHFVDIVHRVRSNRYTCLNYEKRWIVNSMFNFGVNLNSRSIFLGDQELFRNKPALLVSAGPSLEEELERVRSIKEQKLAYIFSVGSAIKALVAHDIHPHATLTMDPNAITQYTFEDYQEKGIDSIPLIYGTSVGFETLQTYPGPLLHMVMDKDTISQNFLRNSDSGGLSVAHDAPTVAITSFELLARLGCNPIILVGQNFAFLGDENYSRSIRYIHEGRDHKATEAELAGTMTVEDVDGNMISTTNGFYLSRQVMENVIKWFPETRVINTTRGGAKIAGTTYMPLAELLGGELESAVVQDDWMESRKANGYDPDHMVRRDKELYAAYEEFLQLFEKISKILQRISEQVNFKRPKQLEASFARFDRCFARIRKNDFFVMFILPMNMVEEVILQNKLTHIWVETDIAEKGRSIVQLFGKYFGDCQRDLEMIKPLYEKLRTDITAYKERSRLH